MTASRDRPPQDAGQLAPAGPISHDQGAAGPIIQAIAGLIPASADPNAPDYGASEVRLIVAHPGRLLRCAACGHRLVLAVRTPDGQAWHMRCIEARDGWQG
jgi:DNA-directed RNA polymerase subunit RPC12/RpoP